MKKSIMAATAAFALALTPLTSASALEVTKSGIEWDIEYSSFGVNEVTDGDVFDSSYLALSIDDGVSFEEYECRNEDLMSETTIGSGVVVTCDELVTVQPGLNVRGFAYVYPDGLKAAVTYKITNTTASSIPFKWKQNHNYGEGLISDSTHADIFSIGDGSSSSEAPAAVAWGPTTQVCSAASGADDAYDNMDVTSESCSLAAGASMGITIFHLLGDVGQASQLETSATALFVTRNADSTLAAGIPSGLTNGNWGITGTLNVSTVPPAAEPFDGSVMTLTGDAVLGEYMTVAFKNGETPVGDYFDVWACPNKDVKAIDGGDTGLCAKMTFWHRASVAGYVKESTALTMSWKLENESVPGLTTPGGSRYLDTNGDPLLMDPPESDVEGAPAGWCAFEGWFIVVHDYSGGGHSNWSPAIGAAGCSEEALANTGAGLDTNTLGGVVVTALVALAGAAVIARRRSTTA